MRETTSIFPPPYTFIMCSLIKHRESFHIFVIEWRAQVAIGSTGAVLLSFYTNLKFLAIKTRSLGLILMVESGHGIECMKLHSHT
jgi:hypothetical protein